MQHAKSRSSPERSRSSPAVAVAILVGRRKRMLSVDRMRRPFFRRTVRLPAAAGASGYRPGAATSDDAGGDVALDPADPASWSAATKPSRKRRQSRRPSRRGTASSQPEDAAQESHGFARAWSHGCLVEVVDVEVVETIAAFEAPKFSKCRSPQAHTRRRDGHPSPHQSSSTGGKCRKR